MPLQKSHGARFWKVWGVVAVVVLMAAAVGYPQSSDHASRPTAEKRASHPMYETDLVPLKPVQCGQCHTSIYNDLKAGGGRHRFECQHCHQKLHGYQPLKSNYEEVIPHCSNCHPGPSHNNEAFGECSVCHPNPHEITRPVPVTEQLAKSCSICHSPFAELMRNHPSEHAKLECITCHDQKLHGLVPSCSTCHDPHFQDQDFRTCASECHPVHNPREITYQRDVSARTCGSCHEEVYVTWQRTPSRHGRVNCAACHTKHGFIPDCRSCHKQPHSDNLLQRFPKCLVCHQDAHDPPVKRRSSQ